MDGGSVTKFVIEVLNWAKFNPRKDVANPSWFRLEHSFIFDPEWDHVDGQEIAVWVFFLAYSSFKKPVFEFDIDTIARKARVTKAKVESAIEKLQLLGCISVSSRERDADVTSTSPTRRNETVRNGTNETYTRPTEVGPASSLPELARIWNEECGTLAKVIKCSNTSMRRKQAAVRWKENPDEAYWRDVIRRINESDFLMGRSPNSHWRADFDWLIKPESSTKVLEGKYNKNIKAFKGIAEILREQELEDASA